jgi:hypothetical protein
MITAGLWDHSFQDGILAEGFLCGLRFELSTSVDYSAV